MEASLGGRKFKCTHNQPRKQNWIAFHFLPGFYNLIEATGRNNGDQAYFRTTHYYQESLSYCVQFYYYIYGSNIGQMRLWLVNRNLAPLGDYLWQQPGMFMQLNSTISIQGNSGPMVLHKYLALATCICLKSNWICLLFTELDTNPEKKAEPIGFRAYASS